MKLRNLVASTMILVVGASNPTFAAWELESENRPSGISAFATTFWLEGRGPISLDDLVQEEEGIEEGTYWASLMVSCVKKRLIIGVNLNMAGSANREISLDDPGYAYLRFDSLSLRKYRTIGVDLPSSINFSVDARAIVSKMLTSKSVSLTVRDRVARERISMNFDVSGLSKAKSRFRYAGCRL